MSFGTPILDRSLFLGRHFVRLRVQVGEVIIRAAVSSLRSATTSALSALRSFPTFLLLLVGAPHQKDNQT